MINEEKQLLLKDLCARLPYGVKYNYGGNEGCDYTMWQISPIAADGAFPLEDIKPYLRPMSSMSEKETYIFRQDILNEVEARCIHSFGCGKYTLAFTESNDWLNSHHFDYRGLIEKGLALVAPEGMYKME